MLKPIAFANAFTAVWFVAYIVCWLLSALAPELIYTISKSWMHSLNLDAVRGTATLDLGPALLGAVTFSVFVWVITYAGATLYNRLAK